ncbi:MAG: hypothetical protein JWR80_10044 [Bradyrhizobium sp.]|nr:hypothetical protein [Bradyrhizobium sp.]
MHEAADTFRRDIVAAMPNLRAYAVSLCRDGERANDLVQDTMLAALTYQDRFIAGTNLPAWLFMILKNKFRSQYRKRKREVEDPDEMMAKSVPFEDSPLKKIEVKEALAFVDMMPAQWRVPLRMIADGATYEEIAAELQEHVGTIKSRVNRGRTQLEAAE